MAKNIHAVQLRKKKEQGKQKKEEGIHHFHVFHHFIQTKEPQRITKFYDPS